MVCLNLFTFLAQNFGNVKIYKKKNKYLGMFRLRLQQKQDLTLNSSLDHIGSNQTIPNVNNLNLNLVYKI